MENTSTPIDAPDHGKNIVLIGSAFFLSALLVTGWLRDRADKTALANAKLDQKINAGLVVAQK